MNPRPSEIIDRLVSKSIVDASGCWIWQGPPYPNGYAQASAAGEQLAHRIAYVALNGPIPPGMHIDHACHNRDASCSGGPSCMHRRCVNPSHMEAVTCRTNLLRSAHSIAGINSRRTECKWGHPFDAENTLLEVARNGQTWRRCRQCARRRREASRTREPLDRAA